MDRLFLETKVIADDSGVISGMAWPFATPDRVGDMIEPGAFKSVKLPIPMLFGHDMADPIGTWEAATEKSDGLHVTGKMLIADVARAREVHALVRAGAVKGISIGFITKKAVARAGGGRTIKSLELFEVSLVTVPMHPGAKVHFRQIRRRRAPARLGNQQRHGAAHEVTSEASLHTRRARRRHLSQRRS